MINIYSSNDNYFIWNADDTMKLRSEHRIIGSLIGCVPRQAFQNSHTWLPFRLSPAEAKLLVDKGIAQIVRNPAVSSEPTPESVKSYWDNRNKKGTEQIAKYKEIREKFITENAAEILRSRKNRKQLSVDNKKGRKQLRRIIKKIEDEMTGSEVWTDEREEACSSSKIANIEGSDSHCALESETTAATCFASSKEAPSNNGDGDADSGIKSQEGQKSRGQQERCDSLSTNFSGPEDVAISKEELEQQKKALIERELNKFQSASLESCMVQLFTESVWKKKEESIPVPLNYPRTEHENLKFLVFKDLWEKGFYITPGLKFGGDYLAYEGDPVMCHALYIIYCISQDESFCAEDIITFGRVGNQVKKTFVLASTTDSGSVEYLSLSWASDLMSRKRHAIAANIAACESLEQTL